MLEYFAVSAAKPVPYATAMGRYNTTSAPRNAIKTLGSERSSEVFCTTLELVPELEVKLAVASTTTSSKLTPTLPVPEDEE
jgi:hypothetical protein